MKKMFFILFFFLTFTNSDKLYAIFSHKIELLQNQKYAKYNLSPYLLFYRDQSGDTGLHEILNKDTSSEIFNRPGNLSNFGLTAEKIWGKFVWANENSIQKEWLLVFESDRIGNEVDVYTVHGNKIISHHHYDYSQTFSKRMIQHRKLIFPLAAPGKGLSQTIYFSVKNQDSIELDATLLTPMALSEKNYKELLILGLYYGIMLSMIFYNLIIFFTTNDKSYLFYILYILSYTFIQLSLDGFLHQYAFPGSAELARNIRVFLATSTMVFALLFALSLLQIKQTYHKLYYAYLFMIFIVSLPAFFQTFFGFSAGLLSLVYILFPFCIFQLFTSFFLAFKIKLARYYFFAWFVFIIGICIHALSYLHIYLPFLNNVTYSMQWGSALEALLLSLALGYKINLLRQSVAEKDHELLQAKFTNLKDKMNPHFVLNTLSIILSYLKREPEKASNALHYFTSAYKYLLRHENEHLILLNQEINFTKDYTNILLIKHPDTLVINYDIQGNLSDITIPFLSLQPVVENAFKHGIRKTPEGFINIFIKVDELKVYIEIINSSNGDSIINPFQGTLGAIRRRLIHFFEQADLTIAGANNQTIVKIVYRHKRIQENITTS